MYVMMYHGKLYGKLWGKYFETGKDSEDFDKMESRIKELEDEIQQLIRKNEECVDSKCNVSTKKFLYPIHSNDIEYFRLMAERIDIMNNNLDISISEFVSIPRIMEIDARIKQINVIACK